jgi:hypothetical protein
MGHLLKVANGHLLKKPSGHLANSHNEIVVDWTGYFQLTSNSLPYFTDAPQTVKQRTNSYSWAYSWWSGVLSDGAEMNISTWLQTYSGTEYWTLDFVRRPHNDTNKTVVFLRRLRSDGFFGAYDVMYRGAASHINTIDSVTISAP